MNNKLLLRLEENPIVAAVNHIEKLKPAIKSPCKIIFLLTGNIYNLKGIIAQSKEAHKNIYVHIDLIEGFSKDKTALKYINEKMNPDGIITTKTNLIKSAKSLNICAIQRLFLLDSLSLETGVNSIHSTRPDAIEVMPGIMPKIITKIHNETKIPIIAGGLISDKEDVIQCLKAGSVGISTSSEKIWYM
ncbi:glycerol-3-phosphate responsive antiterminator [Paramaledivibacter caminithermalis]|uniref:Glycerol uptake operon antiterminator n=1 Tax=Paramaledivibacter caminithermalis (strain DSM 15212 / CIP 107654 / DViRD3) TaxID=1121301 RepID=A0A1M6Q8D3_PARC5|nr:glycerol-3-phosphate responsive antiterminator [Paramaledivibacter caminithermalis]SHK16544.1 glycerol uptake operon antiterminator [Paramaledivibacter caminithermalis DSM 15212]